MSYLEKAKEMQSMIGQGNMMEAFEKFYHPEVVVVEKPTGETRTGKDAQRNAIGQWQSMLTEFHGGGVGSICANEDAQTTTVESWVEVTFKDGNRIKMEEVAVQKWDGDQIVKEEFYYSMPGN